MANSPSHPISKPNIALFPFMSKGHTIPLLGLARLLIRRSIAVTIFTTPANRPFISHSLPSDADVSIVELPFPTNVPDIPPGIESTDKLPSMTLFIPFLNGTKLMQPSFEQALANIHEQVTCVVSDGFLHWTLQSASKFGIPRLSFYGMSHYAMGLSRSAAGLLSLHDSDDEEFTVPCFPWIKLCRNDFDEPFCNRTPTGPHWDFILESAVATTDSFGVLVNSFYELEKTFADYWAREFRPKSWTVGPLSLPSPERIQGPERKKPTWIRWLDEMSAQNLPVLYVAFGSQASIPAAQTREIARGLGDSNTRFLWVARAREGDAFAAGDFEGRGILVKEWVDQREILEHPSVRGFLSHCGWNSVVEGICAGVPILAWPMMAEQFLNAKFVAEEVKIGLRVATVDGRRKGFVSGESLKDSVVELMEGEKGKTVNENVKRLAAEAKRSVAADGGSSWIDLDRLIEETRRAKEINTTTSTSNGELKI